MSKQDREPQCVLGNGVCPPECPLNEQSSNITEELGDDYNPQLSRIAVVFGDVNSGVNVVDVARVMGSCIKEGHPDQDS